MGKWRLDVLGLGSGDCIQLMREVDTRLRVVRFGHGRNVFGSGVAWEEADAPEAELLAIGGRLEGGAAMAACAVAWLDWACAGVADAEKIGDGGAALGEHPELAGGGAADRGLRADLSATDERAEGVVGTAGPEGLGVVADEPRSHRVLGGLARERVEVA